MRLLLVQLITAALLVSSAVAENVYLFRLKKLRNSFHAQIEDQVRSSDDLVLKNYGDTMRHLVMTLQEGQEDMALQIAGLLDKVDEGVSPVCLTALNSQSLYTTADDYLKQCVAEADDGAESISEYVVEDTAKYQARSSDFSLWFMEAYLTNWENIFREEHYDEVYAALSNQVVQWDNVESIGLYSFRQDVVKRLASLSSSVEACMDRVEAVVNAEFEEMQARAVNCSRLLDIMAMKRRAGI